MSPVLAYHATNAEIDFDVFGHTEDLGYHFGSVEAANQRARHLLEDDPDSLESLRVLPCHLHIRAPVRLLDCFTWGVSDVISSLHQAGVIDDAQRDDLSGGGYLDQEMFREIVEAAGYDSVVYSNVTEGGGDSWMVLDPALITFKLAGPDSQVTPERKRMARP